MVYVLMAGLIFIMELFIKEIVEKWGDNKSETNIFYNKIFLTKHHNHGAYMNLLENRSGVVAVLSTILVIVCTIIFIVTLGKAGNTGLKTGMALLLGGAYSNTYDRLKRKYVVDYFGFQTKSKRISNIVYNLSDFCIAIGAVLSAIYWHKK